MWRTGQCWIGDKTKWSGSLWDVAQFYNHSSDILELKNFQVTLP